ncbi:YggS family pyridoxal phosphate-dependent enzyme [Pinibacter aurantiacus]|uniref:Pyridoxal phosphate homeostasis protein n=1 Tax=Pinibacter aurantiacus TaxID=2851599 RepID=A0A9E2SAM6_9BACT|nr:YggS family pyridoxal phosphate-dependent enzyme [Pinibacter aurantiacus]MBV4359526.1 YggS family pyridoxal phosphate-dependent enzyme [Pinibacter aurantiacus]
MAVNIEAYNSIIDELKSTSVQLVAVSKTKPVEDIRTLYDAGQKDFGENYVQEITEKQPALPADIHWHFIGHLQSNKVKYIAPFVYLIHGVDSLKLLQEINKQAAKNNRVIDCLLQVYIAQEESKFGLDENELQEIVANLSSLQNVRVTGLMGMASFSDDLSKVRTEFSNLKTIFNKLKSRELPANCQPTILSMGMSGDYQLAIEEGSTMVRIGSLLFGARK